MMIDKVLMLCPGANPDMAEFQIYLVTQKVLNYCNISALPVELEPIVIEKVVNTLKGSQDGVLKSMKMGDVTTTYETTGVQVNLLDDVKPQLNRFRKVKFL